MIKSFKNKNLEKFYNEGVDDEIDGIDKDRLRLILAQLDAAEELKDFKIPSFNFTRVRKNGTYSISIGNGKRLVFRLIPSNN